MNENIYFIFYRIIIRIILKLFINFLLSLLLMVFYNKKINIIFDFSFSNNNIDDRIFIY